jgi:hypothetical protein
VPIRQGRCLWIYHDRMLLSQRDQRLAINAWGLAQFGLYLIDFEPAIFGEGMGNTVEFVITCAIDTDAIARVRTQSACHSIR